MSAETESRTSEAQRAMQEMLAAEPAVTADAPPFDTDVLETGKDTLGLWRITWNTNAEDSSGAGNSAT